MYDLLKTATDLFEARKERTLALVGNVKEDNCAVLVEKILEINAKDDAMESVFSDYVRKPIHLTVDSYGGSCYDGNGLIGAILASKTPVWTYCYSKAMSMGQLTFIAGERRFISSQATIMFHGVGSMAQGYLPDMEAKLEEGKRLEKMGTDLTVQRTSVSREKLDAIIKEKTEWFINSDEAMEYNFATDVI